MAKKTAKTSTKKSGDRKTTTANTPKVSPVKGKSVDWYIGTLEEWQAEIVTELDALILATVPTATSSIKRAQPVYESNGPLCFMKAAKKHVTFGFMRGADLVDPNELLEGTGAKMRHVKILRDAKLPKAALKKLIKQADKLNAN